MHWKLLYEQSQKQYEKLKSVNDVLLDRIDNLSTKESNYQKTQEGSGD